MHDRCFTKLECHDRAFDLEERSEVDNTTSEKPFNDEFLAFETSADLNDSTLQEQQVICITTRFLKNVMFGVFFSYKVEHDIGEASFFQVFEVRHALHAFLYKFQQFIIVLINSFQNDLFYSRKTIQSVGKLLFS